MLGRQHALGGTAAFLALAPALDAWHPMSGTEVALGAFLAAGGGMLPDLDQHGSTIGRTYGPVTNVAARLVGAVAGGHRNGTHSLLGLAAVAALAWAAVVVGGWWLYGLLWVVLGVAARAYGAEVPSHPAVSAIVHGGVMAGVTAVVAHAGLDLTTPLLGGVVVGAASHVALDMLTPQGCPLGWPLSSARQGVGLVTTGSPWTSWAVTVVLTVTAGWLVYSTAIGWGVIAT